MDGLNQTSTQARRILRALTVWSLLGHAACAPPGPAAAVSTTGALQQAPDGDLVVGLPNTVLNRYGRLGLAATHGDKQLTLNAAKDFAALSLQPGDLVMVAQLQGAQIQTADTDQYGVVTATQGAGLFEFVSVASVDGTTNRIVLDAGCGGLRNDYDPLGQAQVIRVPQYGSLTVGAAASVVALPWDGQIGGIVALRAQQTITVHGEINVSGQGFRGGAAQAMGQDVADQSPDRAGFVYPAASSGGAKGESIAGYTAQYLLTGGLGRGAPANGGGGGNAFKAGGGGGAGSGLAAAWTGQGVMSSGVTGAAAWKLDPAYLAANNQLTTSSGGGRGGYSASTTGLNPLGIAPGDATWLGNLRRERGGRGGHPLAFSAGARLYLGGGGGAGDQNGVGAQATASGDGGAGGGLLYLLARTIQGDGRLAASGAPGKSTGGGSAAAQGAGGGGGGGAIVLNTASVLGTLSVQAVGGDGGRHQSAGAGISDANGPGGGGGGGFLAVPAVSDPGVVYAVDGGSGGSSTSGAMLAFPSNGATSGGPGTQQPLTAAASAPLCTPADLTVAVTRGPGQTIAGTSITFTVVVTNRGPSDATAVQVQALLTPAEKLVAWSCSTSDPTLDAVNCADSPLARIGDINKSLVLPAGVSVTFTVFVDLPQDATGALTYQATVTPPTYLQDLLPGNNTASATAEISEPADVQLQLLGAPNPSVSGEAITVTATVRNTGPLVAHGLQLDLQLPVGAQLHHPPTGPGWTCGEVAADGKVSCTNPQLGLGMVSEVWLALLPDAAATALAVSAAVTTTSNDPDLTDNTATLEVPITFDAASYRAPAIGGGGFGCALSGPVPAGPASVSGSLLGGLLAWSFWRRRRSLSPTRSPGH